MDLTSILNEIKALRAEVAALSLTHPPTVCDVLKCKGVTGKGTACRNKAVECTEYCRMHGDRVEKVAKVVKPKKVMKPKKIQPEHTHDDGGVCLLCETHGDVWDIGLVDCEFEGNNICVE